MVNTKENDRHTILCLKIAQMGIWGKIYSEAAIKFVIETLAPELFSGFPLKVKK